MVNSCAAIGCTYRFKKGDGIGFFRFPVDNERRLLWKAAIKRKNFQVSKTSCICGQHFQTGRPVNDKNHPDYVPSIFKFTKSKRQNTKKYIGTGLTPNRLKSGTPVQVIPINRTPILPKPPSKESVASNIQLKQVIASGPELLALSGKPANVAKNLQGVSGQGTLSTVPLFVNIIPSPIVVTSAPLKNSDVIASDSSKQDSNTTETEATSANSQALLKEINHCKREVRKNIFQAHGELNALRQDIKRLQSELDACDITKSILKNKGKFVYYTGLASEDQFESIIKSLEDDVCITKLSVETQLLMALMKIKLNLETPDLTFRFKTSIHNVQRILNAWIPALEEKYSDLMCAIKRERRKKEDKKLQEKDSSQTSDDATMHTEQEGEKITAKSVKKKPIKQLEVKSKNQNSSPPVLEQRHDLISHKQCKKQLQKEDGIRNLNDDVCKCCFTTELGYLMACICDSGDKCDNTHS